MQSVLCTVYTYCRSAKSGIRIQKKNAQNIIHIRLLNNFVYLLISTKPRNGMKHCGKISSWEQCIYKKKKERKKRNKDAWPGSPKITFSMFTLYWTTSSEQWPSRHFIVSFSFYFINFPFKFNPNWVIFLTLYLSLGLSSFSLLLILKLALLCNKQIENDL